MKRILMLSVVTCFTCVVIIVSCKKKTTTPTYDLSHLNQLFAGLRSTPQNIIVQAGRDTTVYGTDSTLLHFYPNSFRNTIGNIISNGTVYIQLVEMYKPGEMVANRASTTTNGQLLRSGGQVNIKVTMNGEEVFANKYAIGFRQPGASTESMALYYGGNANADSVIDWTISDTTFSGTTADHTMSDTSSGIGWGGGYYYLFTNCTNFNFVNADHFYKGQGNYTTVNVIVPDGTFIPGNTQIFFILPDINCATMSDSRQKYDANSKTYTIGNDDNRMPVGVKYELVVIANKNGSWFYYETSGTTTTGMSINAALAPETQGDIKARLAGL